MSDLVQMTFYALLSPETRIFVQEKTLAIKARLKRTVEDIVLIGKDLKAVQEKLRDENKTDEKQGNGQFVQWIEDEFEMSYQTAYNFMNVADKFGDEENFKRFEKIPPTALYLLSAPQTPQAVVEKALSSEELPDIKTLREEIKKAKESERQAKVAEAKAKADAQAVQQRLSNLTGTSQKELDALTKQIKDLEAEIETITTPAIEIREVEKEVVPSSVTMKLQKLQQQLDDLKKERKSQEDRIQKLNADLSVAVRKQITAENNDRIRQGWRQITSETHGTMMRLLGQWPTPLDVRAFEADDWERLSHLKETLQRVLEECNNLHYDGDNLIIDSNPYALSVVE